MAGETIITVVGNLTADPELRSTKNGRSVAGFTIASTPRTFDRQSNQWADGDALFLRCTVWGDLAEHCASSLAKGMRVVAQGRLTQHSWEDEQHQKRSSVELQVDEIGPSCGMRRRRWPRRSGVRLERMGIRTPLRPAIRAGRPLRIRCRRPTRGVSHRTNRHRSVISASRNPNRISKDES